MDLYDFLQHQQSVLHGAEVSSSNVDEIIEEIGEDIDLLIDQGPCEIGIASTIVDLSQDVPKVIRIGAISEEKVLEVLTAL
jgi:L-threonylcarbamoyladenylate synthase